MTHYPLQIVCPTCHEKTLMRGFSYAAGSEYCFTTYCATCDKELHLNITSTTIENWVFHNEMTLSSNDNAFLHEMLVSWPESKQLAPPK
jgi:hypothetical protein